MLKGLCRADFEDAQEPAGQKGFGSPPRQCHCLLLSDTVCRLSDFSPCALDVSIAPSEGQRHGLLQVLEVPPLRRNGSVGATSEKKWECWCCESDLH